MLPFLIGGFVGVCILIYVSFKPVPSEEVEEREKATLAKSGNIKMSKEEIEAQREMVREAAKENLFKMNPELKNLSEEELQDVVRKRKERFLGNLDPVARESIEKYAKMTQKEMEKLSRMSPEEIRERASEIEANEFRFILIKFLIVAACIYFFCVFYFESFSPIDLKDKILKEWANSGPSGRPFNETDDLIPNPLIDASNIPDL